MLLGQKKRGSTKFPKMISLFFGRGNDATGSKRRQRKRKRKRGKEKGRLNEGRYQAISLDVFSMC